MSKLFLVRCDLPKKENSDLPLDEVERASAFKLGTVLSSFFIGKIFSSHAIRALHTAQILGQQQAESYVLFSHRDAN
ncbi:histidine phosphatase family protein [Candidatus Similichlamydia epinepheli]|uniref:histidine phosphatase family protein n=1 Tax=Candidatus Similichlamydia epinepheli TaxID=1903953 RepID=UPI0013008DEF|nr:histidine phosphatase family protein [Candidatus Similichlamydia epinepheli]